MQLYITGEKADIKPIDEKSLNIVERWYCENGTYGFATGRKSFSNIFNALPGSFVSGIYAKNGEIIGLITGELRKARDTVLWIRTFLIDAAWQRKRFGTYSFGLLCNYASGHFNAKRVYLSVHEENRAGINFWSKMGMQCIRIIETKEQEMNCKILIFEKVL